MTKKAKPNILITGTPGVGKSLLCYAMSQQYKYRWLEVSDIAKGNNFIDGYDAELDCPIINEDKVVDFLEPIMGCGGNIVEYHSCNFFPERWFQAVFVLTCNNTTLYDRLVSRGYKGKKLTANIECEIFQTILDEARDSYKNNIVHVLKGDSDECFSVSCGQISQWIYKYNL